MYKKLLIIAAMFIIVRLLIILAYKDTYYYYGMVSSQFAIAEAAYHGHWFSQDKMLVTAVRKEALKNNRYIPIEDWKDYQGSGNYTTFPAQDLPGFGYLIAFTSKYFSHKLTSKYAFAVQIILELISVLIFIYCISLVLGARIAFLSGLIYVLSYPFIWPIASQPMRDIFVMAIYSFCIAAFFIFSRKNDTFSYLTAYFLVAMSSVLLWVRPFGYYFFFMISPLIFFIRNKSALSRLMFFIIVIISPVLIFGYQFKQFNVKHYGVADTHFLGRTLWEGMGNVKDNPYGFVLDDGALVPWVKNFYKKDVEYSSPEMNKVLGDYALKVIREDPVFYFRTIIVRCKAILKCPLHLIYTTPLPQVTLEKSGLSLMEYMKQYPKDFVYSVFNGLAGIIFFYLGLIFAFLMFISLKDIRLKLVILVSPLLYTLTAQILIHFEPRFLATGAWVLIVPFAWYIDKMLYSKKRI